MPTYHQTSPAVTETTPTRRHQSTLYNFLSFGVQFYPARHYMVVVGTLRRYSAELFIARR